MIGLSLPQYEQALIFHPSTIGCFWSQYERTFIVNIVNDYCTIYTIKLNKMKVKYTTVAALAVKTKVLEYAPV
jgi:hypothetical protein